MSLSLNLTPLTHAIRYGALGSGDNTRHVLSLNGVDQYLKFARPVVGVGQGTIRIVCKLSDLGNAVIHIADAGEDSARFYVRKLFSATAYDAPAGISVKVDTLNNTVVYGALTEISVTGDFTGLSLAQFFGRFNDIEFAKAQVFSISYTDEAQAFAYDFNVAQNYWLPDGFELLRNLSTTADYVESKAGLGSGYYSNGVMYLAGEDFANRGGLVNEGLPTETNAVFKVNFTASSQVRVRVINASDSVTILDWAAYAAGGHDLFFSALSDTTEVEVRNQDGGVAEVSGFAVHKVPNALILQSPSANIADDFEPMVQRGDGHWVGKESLTYFTSGTGVSFDGSTAAFDREAYQELVFRADAGESVLVSCNVANAVGITGGIYNNAPGYTSVVPNSTPAGKHSKEILLTGLNLRMYPGSFGTDYDDVQLNSLKVNHLIKLSDHLQKQFIIEQTKAAVAGYQAKKKTRNITGLDGVDDTAVIEGLTQPAGKFSLGASFVCNSEGATANLMLLGDALIRISGANEATVWTNVSQGAAVFSNLASTQGAINTLECVFEMGSADVELIFNNQTVGVVSAATILNTWDGRLRISEWNDINFDGSIFDVFYIDHETPFPAGHGGNSGFWPLDDPKGTIAANKLGLDSKGSVIVKDGAGLGVDVAATVNLSLANGTTRNGNTLSVDIAGFQDIAAGFGALPAVPHMVTVQTAGVGAVYIEGGGLGAWVSVGNPVTLHSDGADIVLKGTDFVGTIILNILEAHGYGEWQGLSATFEETQQVTRDEDGAYVQLVQTSVEDMSGGGWVNTVFTEHNSVGNTVTIRTANMTPPPSVGDLIETPYGNLEFVSVGASPAEFAVDASYEADLATWLRTKIANGETLNIHKRILLSAELQRQHDLAIVETSVGKLLKKVEKSMVLAEFDGVDDESGLISLEETKSFAFEHHAESNRLSHHQQIIGSDSSGAFWIVRILNTDTYEMRVYTDQGLFTNLVTAENVDGMLSRFTMELSDGKWITSVNNIEEISAIPLGAKMLAGDIQLGNRGENSAETYRLQGKSGFLSYLDKSNPKSSRFYVHNPDGYLEDKLHSDGSMNGTYSGMPVDFSNIKAFKKSGDDWISVDQLTTIKGA